jgi:hypothetical protein
MRHTMGAGQLTHAIKPKRRKCKHANSTFSPPLISAAVGRPIAGLRKRPLGRPLGDSSATGARGSRGRRWETSKAAGGAEGGGRTRGRPHGRVQFGAGAALWGWPAPGGESGTAKARGVGFGKGRGGEKRGEVGLELKAWVLEGQRTWGVAWVAGICRCGRPGRLAIPIRGLRPWAVRLYVRFGISINDRLLFRSVQADKKSTSM